MGILGFSSKENIGEFASELCKELTAKYPVAMDNNSQSMVSEKNLSKTLEGVLIKAADFKTRNKLCELLAQFARKFTYIFFTRKP